MTWAVDFGWNTGSSHQFDSHLFFIFFFQSSFNFFISFFPNQWKDCQKPFFLSNKHFLLLESLPRTSMPTLKKYVEPRLRCEFDSFYTFQLRLGTKKRPSANNYPRLLGNEQETQMLKSKGVKIQFTIQPEVIHGLLMYGKQYIYSVPLCDLSYECACCQMQCSDWSDLWKKVMHQICPAKLSGRCEWWVKQNIFTAFKLSF